MRNWPRIAFTAALFPVACFAASAEPVTVDARTQAGPIIEILSRRAEADSLAAAGLLSAFGHREESLPLLHQASLMAPERADLAWLHLQFCQQDSSCDPEPLETRLRTLDEKNGAGWFGALARASKRGDEQAASAALAAIARSERVDTYWTTLVARLSRQVASTGAVSVLDAASQIIGGLAAIAIPAYATISNSCKGASVMRDDVAQVCRGVAESLLNGDTVITEMVGVHIARQTWPENSPKWAEATEVRRKWDEREVLGESLSAWIVAHPDEYLALCERYRREQDVFKAAQIAMDKNPGR